jgi:hypothetical protein
MTQSERRTIGLDRPLRLDWLDAVAGQLASGATPREARDYAWGLLDGVVAGNSAQSARGKTMTVLARVWLTPPAVAASLRDDAIRLVGSVDAEERLAIHWAMLSAAYPFFVDVASGVGRALSLNGEVALSQLVRRLTEVWGDRSTLRPAAQRLVRSMAAWGVLEEGPRRGLYLPPGKRLVVSSAVAQLLVEGLLVDAQRGIPLAQLISHPSTFPFELRVDVTTLRGTNRLRVHRQGDQTDVIEREDRQARAVLPLFEQGSMRGRLAG